LPHTWARRGQDGSGDIGGHYFIVKEEASGYPSVAGFKSLIGEELKTL
jgi:hypothetical protein